MIEVTQLLDVFDKLEESGVDLNDCVLFENDGSNMAPDTRFIVMQKKDLPDA